MRRICIAMVIGLAWVAQAEACDCPGPSPVGVSVARTDAVFMGVAIAVRDSSELGEDGSEGVPARVATFRVETSWKGVRADTVVHVWTGRGGGDCGFGFEQEHRYLVFAHGADLKTGICDRTTPVRFERGLIDSLGAPLSQSKRLFKRRTPTPSPQGTAP
jgi:hypothetical protein